MTKEILLGLDENKPVGELILDLDFENSIVGSTDLPDVSGNYSFSPSGPLGTSNVINDPTLGKSFYFDGTVYFSETNGNLLNIYNRDFDLSIRFRQDDLATRRLFATGDYQSVISSGSLIVLNQTSSPSRLQYFTAGVAVGFVRQYWPATNPDLDTALRIFKRGNKITFLNESLGTSWEYDHFDSTGESFLSVAGSPDGTLAAGNFKGVLKSLKVWVY